MNTHILIDEKIPFIQGIIEKLPFPGGVTVEYLPAAAMTPERVKDCDALVIRTRTHCDEQLLAGSHVKFIATATIGFDHIDTAYCARQGIVWKNAPGCNADSVAQYMESVFYLLSEHLNRPLPDFSLGIVGVGHVGSRVEALAHRLGMRVFLCDPPRAREEKEEKNKFITLDEIARNADIITFHTPLTRTGEDATFHLADESFFSERLRPGSVIVNTSRGEVVDNEALLRALKTGRVKEAVIDVWEHEPHPLPELLEQAFIATPHIAGYSADGKANATRMSLESLCRFFQIPLSAIPPITPPAPPVCRFPAGSTPAEQALFTYDPRRDSRALKENPEAFEAQRSNYPLRRERKAYSE
ncbi:MAG: 4-phosphoerythronate dehydrogenase [Bacteroidaceae bacterium]|jgi:erythronate-4-phosphate dehydrogenase